MTYKNVRTYDAGNDVLRVEAENKDGQLVQASGWMSAIPKTKTGDYIKGLLDEQNPAPSKTLKKYKEL